jgi:hypothetical protein
VLARRPFLPCFSTANPALLHSARCPSGQVPPPRAPDDCADPHVVSAWAPWRSAVKFRVRLPAGGVRAGLPAFMAPSVTARPGGTCPVGADAAEAHSQGPVPVPGTAPSIRCRVTGTAPISPVPGVSPTAAASVARCCGSPDRAGAHRWKRVVARATSLCHSCGNRPGPEPQQRATDAGHHDTTPGSPGSAPARAPAGAAVASRLRELSAAETAQQPPKLNGIAPWRPRQDDVGPRPPAPGPTPGQRGGAGRRGVPGGVGLPGGVGVPGGVGGVRSGLGGRWLLRLP